MALLRRIESGPTNPAPLPDYNVQLAGAKGDGVSINDVTLTSGNAAVTSAHTFSPNDAGKVFVVSGLKKTAGNVTSGNATITLADAPAATDLYGPIWIDIDGTLVNAYKTSVHTISGSVITLKTAYSGGNITNATILIGNASFGGTISSVSAGVATLSTTATNSTKYGIMVFGTDDTLALQSAYAAAMAAGIPAYHPNGIYMVGGTPQAFSPIYGSAGSRAAQILLPVVNESSPAACLTLAGPQTPIAGELYFALTSPVTNVGAIIQTTRTTSTAGDCIIGCPGATSWNSSNNLHVTVQNLIFRQPLNPRMTDLDVVNARTSESLNVYHDLVCSVVMSSAPTNTNVIAERLAGNNNDVSTGGSYIRVTGRYTTVDPAEHHHFQYICAQSCYHGLTFGIINGVGVYPVTIERFYAGECPFGIYVIGAFVPLVKIETASFEQNNPPSGNSAFTAYGVTDLPEWMNISNATVTGADIYDPSSLLYGKINYYSHDQLNGPGTVNTLTINGAQNILIHCMAGDISTSTSNPVTVDFTGFSTGSNGTWQDTVHNITVPGAGDWIIDFSVEALAILGSVGQVDMQMQLYDITNSAAVAYSICPIISVNNATEARYQLATRSVPVRTSGPTAYRVRVQNNFFNGASAISTFQSPRSGVTGNGNLLTWKAR